MLSPTWKLNVRADPNFHVVHQSLDGGTGDEVYVSLNVEQLTLAIEYVPNEQGEGFEERLANAKRQLPLGEFVFETIEALDAAYAEKAAVLYDSDNEDFFLRDTDNRIESPVDLARWRQLRGVFAEGHMSDTERLAYGVASRLSTACEGRKLSNVVFYWSDDGCACAYINSGGLNKGINAIKKRVKKSGWLDGDLVDVSVALVEDLLGGSGADPADLRQVVAAVNRAFYPVCALLEASKMFRMVPVAKKFTVLSVWDHAESQVDFKLRRAHH